MSLLRPIFLSILCLAVTLPASSVRSSNSNTENLDAANRIESVMETTGITAAGISTEAFQTALAGYERMLEQATIQPGALLTIVDFSLPSTSERMVIYDVANNEIRYISLVAHGRNSGNNMATSFSNIPQSYQSSVGFYRTAETYFGKHGYSLRLDGLEAGINDKARERAIVIHGAEYATARFAEQHGRLGRSYGCPSVPPESSREIIDMIKEGNVLFIYGNDTEYAAHSTVLNR